MRFSALLLTFGLAGGALAQSRISTELVGVVFEDLNENRRRDPGESGLADAVVCSRSGCALSDSDGSYAVAIEPGYRVVFVSVPPGFQAVGPAWRRIPQDPDEWLVNLSLKPMDPKSAFSFIHASDTHLDGASQPRLERLRALVVREQPDFLLVTGDLVRDALRVPADTAEPLFAMYREQMAKMPVPVWSVPGNHDNFGVERRLSQVDASHPLYGKAMYRRYLGPTYFSFNYGGVHFVGLDSVDVQGDWYYGHLDRTQLLWLEQDLAFVPEDTPVVTFNHIPFFSALTQAWGYYPAEDSPGSTIDIDGVTQFRHVVSNFSELMDVIGSRPYPLALGGHVHAREEMVFGDERVTTRFHQTAAVVDGTGEDYGMKLLSGVTWYDFRDGNLVDWRFMPLDGTVER